MKKILYVATSDIHLSTFHRPYINWLVENGCQVDIAIEKRGNYTFSGVTNSFCLNFPRKLLSKDLFKSYKELKVIIDNGKYNLIHCHTPIPSMLARLAARQARKNKTKVLYTAHGFHFYNGASLLRWFMYFSAEYILSKCTDGIVTINKEDFNYVNGKMLNKEAWYIPGIGVDSKRFKPSVKEVKIKLRKEIGYSEKQFIVLYIAEFIPRKNHEFIIKSIYLLKNRMPELRVLFAGQGVLLDDMKNLTQSLGLTSFIDFLGFRNDIEKLCIIADLGISASKHEGLGLGLVENMMCGVPVVATVDRGHKEIVINGFNGYLYNQNETNEFIEILSYMYQNTDKRLEMGKNAIEKAQEFELAKSLREMEKIYSYYLY